MRSKCICSSVSHSIRLSVRAKRGIWTKRVFMRTNGIFFSASVERILRLFTNFYLQRMFSIFLRNDHDCKVVDPYNRLPQDWPHWGIQRIGWPANQSRFVTKWLKRGRVHNLDSLKKELWTKILLKKHKHTKNQILASTQCLDFTRNTTWLASCFSLIKKSK